MLVFSQHPVSLHPSEVQMLVFSQHPVSLHPSEVQMLVFSQHPVLKHSQSVSSINVKDQVSDPYKRRRKIIVLCILIFMFVDSRRKEKDSE
jgi:hypothetical protein